jgi:NUMOD4 motif/HNH endonuclease
MSNSNLSAWLEKWVRIPFGDVENPPHYEVSNLGRVKSFKNSKDGTIIKGSVIQGYRSLNLRLSGGKTINFYIHKLVAIHFVGLPADELQKFIVHLDFDKQNNRAENLKWATKDEMVEHNRLNPAVINRKIPTRTKNYKLTESKVKVIKKMLKNDKNRYKTIARQFGITHTQLNRIKNGENWKNVTIDDE